VANKIQKDKIAPTPSVLGKFYDLIPSEAIREHCKKIEYPLDALDCMYLVFKNKTKSVPEKHELYRKIMRVFPEPEFPKEIKSRLKEEHNCTSSWYEILEEHIETEDELLNRFTADAQEPVYFDYDEYRTLEECIAYAKEPIGTVDVENTKVKIQATVCGNGNIYFHADTVFEEIISQEYTCAFPVPFERGDILISSYRELCVFDSFDPASALVTVYIRPYESETFAKKQVENMTLNLFDGALDSKEKILRVLSDYLKGKIGVESLMNACVINAKIHALNQTKQDLRWDHTAGYLYDVFEENRPEDLNEDDSDFFDIVR